MSTDIAGGRPSAWSLVFVPAVITLAVTGLRLLGEIRNWDTVLFSKDAGGALAIFGISWLVFVFGFYYGFRLTRAGHGPKQKIMSLLAHVAAFALIVGAFFVLDKTGVEFPEKAIYFGVAALAASLIGLAVWPALFRVNLLYGLLARIPVVAVTYFAVHKGWGTHYEQVAPGFPEVTADERVMYLSWAQLTFWIAFTIIAGGFAGGIGSFLARRR